MEKLEKSGGNILGFEQVKFVLLKKKNLTKYSIKMFKIQDY